MYDFYVECSGSFGVVVIQDLVVGLFVVCEVVLFGKVDFVVVIQQVEVGWVECNVFDMCVVIVLMVVKLVVVLQFGDVDYVMFVGSNMLLNVIGFEWFFMVIWLVICMLFLGVWLMVVGLIVVVFMIVVFEGVEMFGIVFDFVLFYVVVGVVILLLMVGLGFKIKLIDVFVQGKVIVVMFVMVQGVEEQVVVVVMLIDDLVVFVIVIVDLLCDLVRCVDCVLVLFVVVCWYFLLEICYGLFVDWFCVIIVMMLWLFVI